MTNHTMPNNYLVCSEKFLRTKAPWRMDGSLLGQLSNDHYIASFDSSLKEDLEELAVDVSRSLRQDLKGKDVDNVVFVGYESDCALLPLIQKHSKIKFDAAVLVNNKEPKETYKSMLKTCVFYCVFTKPKLIGNTAKWAKIVDFAPTKIPAYMSSKTAYTVASFLIYDFYKVNYLTKTPSTVIELN